MFWKQRPTLCKIPSVVSNKHQGLERHSRNPKFEHNTVRFSAKRWEVEFAKSWAQMRDWE